MPLLIKQKLKYNFLGFSPTNDFMISDKISRLKFYIRVIGLLHGDDDPLQY